MRNEERKTKEGLLELRKLAFGQGAKAVVKQLVGLRKLSFCVRRLEVGQSYFLVLGFPLLVSSDLKGQSEAEPDAVDKDEKRGKKDQGHRLRTPTCGLSRLNVEVDDRSADAHVHGEDGQRGQDHETHQVSRQTTLVSPERTSVAKPL